MAIQLKILSKFLLRVWWILSKKNFLSIASFFPVTLLWVNAFQSQQRHINFLIKPFSDFFSLLWFSFFFWRENTNKNVQSKELSLQSSTILMITSVCFLSFFLFIYSKYECVYVMLMMMTLFIPFLSIYFSMYHFFYSKRRKKMQLQSTQMHAHRIKCVHLLISMDEWMNIIKIYLYFHISYWNG